MGNRRKSPPCLLRTFRELASSYSSTFFQDQCTRLGDTQAGRAIWTCGPADRAEPSMSSRSAAEKVRLSPIKRFRSGPCLKLSGHFEVADIVGFFRDSQDSGDDVAVRSDE